MFSIEPPITKELLLQSFPEEYYMSFYLGIPITTELFTSPLRTDHRPTCGFYKSDKTGLRFKDFGTGVNYNFIDVVMVLNGCSYYKAIQIIAHDFGIVKSLLLTERLPPLKYDGNIIPNKPICDIKVELKEFSDKELHWWGEFGISKDLLKEGRVYSLKAVFLNNEPSFFSSEKMPIYGYFFGHEEGRELWKIYFPTKIKYRFLLNTSKLQGVHMLPKTGDLVIITKSMKDILTLRNMGFYAIAPQSENSYPKKEQIEALQKRFKTILFWYDPDKVGLASMSHLRKLYRTLFYWIPSSYKSKDISDFYKKHGEKKTREFMKQLEEKINNGKLDYHYTKHDFKNGR